MSILDKPAKTGILRRDKEAAMNFRALKEAVAQARNDAAARLGEALGADAPAIIFTGPRAVNELFDWLASDTNGASAPPSNRSNADD